jgi:hypothetical protein
MIDAEEQAKRIQRCFEDFSLILPVYSEQQRRAVRMAMNKDIAVLIPAWFRDLSTVCLLNQEKFVEYAEYIVSSLNYILGKTDGYQQPEGIDPVLRQALEQAIKIELLNQQKKDKKLAKKSEQPTVN